MEGLVNYSSEDDQDEPGHRKPAERGTHVNAGKSEKSGSGSRNAGGGGRSSYRDEASDNRNKSYSRGGRSSLFQRDNKERYGSSKDVRDSRDFNNGHQRYDNKQTHDRHYQHHGRDYKNDEFNKRERSRTDERYNSRHSNTKGSYNQNSREHRPRYSGGNSHDNSRSRHYRSSRGDDEREERNERVSNTRPERHRQQSNKCAPRSRRSHTRSQSRSKSRSRSRSHSKDRRSSPAIERTQRSTPSKAYEVNSSPASEKISEKSQYIHSGSTEQSTVNKIVPLMSLPLSDIAPKHPSLVAVTTTTHAASGESNMNANEPAVIQLPNYYNPSVINPTKYAEQVQKRKLLWGAKKNEDTAAAKWNNAQFSQDNDGKVASKFMRLMGIKNASGAKTEAEDKPAPAPAPDVKSREAMFSSMEHQYEVARQATHTMRGVGLGFGSSRPF